MDDLPTDYDAVIVGTGMTESIIAAAISRIGKKVLHLDSNDYYGENWASFNVENIENWARQAEKSENEDSISAEDFKGLVEENENVIKIYKRSNISNVKLKSYKEQEVLPTDDLESEMEMREKQEVEPPIDSFEKCSKKFNLDLSPKLLFSKGMMVNLLLSSNVARYAEFKSFSRVLTWRCNQLEPVPCSRADVFATKNVSVVQKRLLVKILTLCADYKNKLEEFQGFENKTFLDYLKHKKLPENLIHYILYAIAMGDNRTPCMDGVKAAKDFLESLGLYGNTPFLFPMYGSGELPQCFCRLCAVFGGIYCLQRGIKGIVVKDNKCTDVISGEKRIKTNSVVLSSAFAPGKLVNGKTGENITRGIFITDRSILKSEKDSLTLLQFPPISQISNNSVTVIELGPGTCTCPEKYFVVHMTTKMTRNASSDLEHVVEFLFQREGQEVVADATKPRVLWSLTWNAVRGNFEPDASWPVNVKICNNVDSGLDYQISIEEARRIFKELYPDEDFLPRAPDPDEIVFECDEKPSVDEGVVKESAEVENADETNLNQGDNHSSDL